MSHVGIETTQHVNINYRIASIGDRLFAYAIDAIILVIYGITIVSLWSTFFDTDDPTIFAEAFWIPFLLVVIPSFIYKFTLEVIWGGYTVGKWLVGIRVVKIDGTRAGISNYLLRWLFSLFEITMTQGTIATMTIMINGKGQRLGDIVGKTCVIKKKRKVSLEDTMYSELEKEYEIIFQKIGDLSDQDVTIIKEVINARKGYDKNTWFAMMQRTRKLIENKIGESEEKMDALQYLEAVIKDYNAHHGLRE